MSKSKTKTPPRRPAVKVSLKPGVPRGRPGGAKIGDTMPAMAASQRQIQALKTKLATAWAKIDELQARADTDALLNIYNRRGFERELDRALAYIKRYKVSGVLVVLDLDRLKSVNDMFGHAAGDTVLKEIASLLTRQVRSSDVVGRLGGDEFGLLLWNVSEAEGLAKAKALEDEIDHLKFMFKDQSAFVGASAGIALLGPKDDAGTVMEQADRAMYLRKDLRKSARSSACAKL